MRPACASWPACLVDGELGLDALAALLQRRVAHDALDVQLAVLFEVLGRGHAVCGVHGKGEHAREDDAWGG